MLVDYYKVLDLHPPSSALTAPTQDDIKAAYRQALLKHHPDKLGCKPSQTAPYSIDEIALAYKILSDPITRIDADKSLRLRGEQKAKEHTMAHHPGLEIVDLDDLAFDVDKSVWYRGCRCGNERGFVVTENELEKEVEQGEVMVGCVGCSLWLRVVFQVADDG